ncbi:MAG TPA: prolyl oligopeptidase family serine peptidase [Streptosporangiaceae bacterium]|nr:prolyl oligopeptidase family serine peptidase [Streptosporangiaceae bacterium]
MTESFPRQQARTRGFSLGVPRSFQISPDGSRVAFLRSKGGTDPVTCLWVLDVSTGAEHLAADPAGIGADGDVPAAERARRERSRERAAGIVGYATDTALTMAAFALNGQVYVTDLSPDSKPRALGARSPAIDPRPDPAGNRVAYACDGALRVTDLSSGEDRELIGPDGEAGVSFGLAEFIAAEEMGRMRGYWWAPDGSALLVARVDEKPVRTWYIADPANPDRPPSPARYPAAGTPNADVSLLLVRLDGTRSPVSWDRGGFPYLVTVSWEDTDPLIVVQSRDQRRMRLLSADPGRDAVTVLREDTDDRWVDVVPGVPALAGGGRIAWTADAGGSKRLLVAMAEEYATGTAAPVTPAGLQVRAIADAGDDGVLFTASGQDPAEVSLWHYGSGGLARLTPDHGVHAARRSGGTTVIASQSLAADGVTVRVLRDGPASAVPAWGDGPPKSPRMPAGGDGPAAPSRVAATEAGRIASLAEIPNLPVPQPALFAAGTGGIPAALLLPSWHEPGSGKLPVLLDPYGGPHGQRVVAARSAFLTSQWLAEQGFAVVIADGRGTPGRGPEWDRAVWHDLSGPVLADQVEALAAAAERCGDLDTARVGIRGWSFGGYLAALAVLRRPDVFHAAVAGAPPTDWLLYDTHYTERYLGHPDEDRGPYEACSPIRDAQRLRGAGVTRRPLMIIHGLADDNVTVAHTLRLSSALLAAGYPHSVLPLSGVTHMASQEEVAENLLLLQVDFLRQALGDGRDQAADRGEAAGGGAAAGRGAV